jgi:hypothetical protein
VKPSLIALATVAIVSAMLAIPALASFDHHFSVSLGLRSYREIAPNQDRTKFTVRLVGPQHRHVRAGRLWGVCRAPNRAVRCRFYAHLNGRVGGSGNLTARGRISEGGRTRLRVVIGSDDFDGVTGKLLITNPSAGRTHLHFDLRR